jgi:hypothetical protein
MSRANLLWLLAYLALMAALVGGMFRARERVLATLGTPEARADWQTWRSDVRGRVERGEGPARRRVPPSAEPSLLVLLRDDFPTCLAVAVVFPSLLYLVLMILLRGALRGGER